MVICHTYIYTYMCVYTWVKNCDDMNIHVYTPALFQEPFQWWGYGFCILGDQCQKLEYILPRKSAFRSGEAPNSRPHENIPEDVGLECRRASVRVFVRVGDSYQAGCAAAAARPLDRTIDMRYIDRGAQKRVRGGEGALAPSCHAPQGHNQTR